MGVALAGATLAAPRASAATSASTYVERHVDALPDAALVQTDPHDLVDRRRQEIAVGLGNDRRALFFSWALSQILVFWLVWRTGWAARVRDMLRRRIGPPFAVRFFYGAALALAGGIAAFPASFLQHRVNVLYDQSVESFANWFRDGLLRVALDAIVVGLAVALILWLVERSRQWWVYTLAGLFCVSLAIGYVEPVVLAPMFNKYRPLPAQDPLTVAIARLQQAAHLPRAPIYVADSSRQSELPSTRVAGYGPTSRIIIGDTLLKRTRGEVLFGVARDLAHYLRNDTLRTTFVWTFLLAVAVAAAVLVAERIRFRRDDDPLTRLALIAALSGLVGLLLYPLYNGYSRHIERRADEYALMLTGDRAGAVRTFIRLADRRFVSLCAPKWAVYYFYNVPPLGTRIAVATGKRDYCR